jgi:DNA helicase-2/ATP-dependent DNA helicase PcrA
MADILTGLNPQQLEAVTHQGSPLLLLAGAGSGKTRVLTHRAAWFVQQKLTTPSHILLLTFTNKAADEMKQRMAALIGSSSNSASGNMFAGTFHSFCCRLLRQDGAVLGISPKFAIYDSQDQEDLVKTILKELDFNPKEFKPSSVLYFIENAKNNYQTPSEAKTLASGYWAEHAALVYQKYQQKLNQFQALDFNDLLFQSVALLQNYPDILSKYQQLYQYVLVDEYQDTNQIQYLLTKLLAQSHGRITAVGDASQAIYGWRGADYRNLISFTADFNDTKVINLEQNYRSTNTILEAANSVIAKNQGHPILKLYSVRPSGDKIRVCQAESEVDEANYIANRIAFIHDNYQVPYRDIAVLYRMNAQSRVIEEAFLKINIPYVLIGGIKFYERAEIKDIVAMLRLVANPADLLSQDRIEKALGKRRLAAFLEYLPNIDTTNLTSLQILESVVTNSGYLNKFDPKNEEDQRRIENIKELKSVAATHHSLTQFLENIALVQQEYSIQEKHKKKENREGIRLMTLHSSKGLEFEVVFLVGFEEGILPHSRCLVDPTQVEEERRLCYVGITRAKTWLYITHASQRLYFGKSSLNQPSRFLTDIPISLVEEEILTTRITSHSRISSDDDLVYDPDIY